MQNQDGMVFELLTGDALEDGPITLGAAGHILDMVKIELVPTVITD